MEIDARYNNSYDKGEISISEGNTQIVVDWMDKKETEIVAEQLLQAYLDLTGYSLLDKLDEIEDAFSEYVEDGDTDALQEVYRKIQELREELNA